MDGQMGYDQLRLAPGARKDLYGTRRIPDLVLPIMVELIAATENIVCSWFPRSGRTFSKVIPRRVDLRANTGHKDADLTNPGFYTRGRFVGGVVNR